MTEQEKNELLEELEQRFEKKYKGCQMIRMRKYESL